MGEDAGQDNQLQQDRDRQPGMSLDEIHRHTFGFRLRESDGNLGADGRDVKRFISTIDIVFFNIRKDSAVTMP